VDINSGAESEDDTVAVDAQEAAMASCCGEGCCQGGALMCALTQRAPALFELVECR